MENLSVQYVDINSITPYENNPRNNDDAVEYVKNSIKKFGWKQAIVVDKDMVIIAGHTRYKAAQELGLTKVPVFIATDLTPEEVNEYRLADNKTAEKSGWDFEKLDIELANITDDMTQFGFENVTDNLNLDDFFSEQDNEEPKEKKTKTQMVTCPYCGKEFEVEVE